MIRPKSPHLPTDDPAFVSLLTDAPVLDPEYLDEAIIGHDTNDDGDIILVYGYTELVETYMKYEDWSEEDAIEWIDFNTVRALPYMGARAPIIRITSGETDDNENEERPLGNPGSPERGSQNTERQ
jgi:hypothetical protein